MSRNVQHRVHVRIEAVAAHPAIYQLDTHLRSSDVAAADQIYFMVLLQSITRWPPVGNRPVYGHRQLGSDGATRGQYSWPRARCALWFMSTGLRFLFLVRRSVFFEVSTWVPHRRPAGRQYIMVDSSRCDYLTNWLYKVPWCDWSI